jgi:transcriptional regulator with GAF, ATPase, and Fis domain
MVPTHQRETWLAELFVKLSDTLVNGFDIVDLLGDLTEGSVDLLTVSSASILLSDPRGKLRAMASSNEGARALELLELQNSEGPCLDCFTTRSQVIAPDLASLAERWPTFVPAAEALGIVGVYALPLRLRSDVLGALNLFTESSVPLDAQDLRIAQALADAATIAVLNYRASLGQTKVIDQLQTALNSRIIIEQAKGFLSAVTGGDMDEAFVLLRSYARSHQTPLTTVARSVATGEMTVSRLISEPPGGGRRE